MLEPAEAALIAGMVASPTGYDPLPHREAAGKRRALVLQRMLEQGYISPRSSEEALETSLPTRNDIQPPVEDTAYPYFTSWVKQQVVDKLGGGQEGARKAFEGGLTVQTTLDVRLQEAAEQAVDAWLPVRGRPARVARRDRQRHQRGARDGRRRRLLARAPFNLATQGQRQPGLGVQAVRARPGARATASRPTRPGARARSTSASRRKKGRCTEDFDVNNYEDAYGGIRTLRTATTYSDNSVYAQLGVKVGTRKIAQLARRMGIRTPVSHNFAMTLGGLKEGVTPLDMAHAYETFAQHGRFTYSTMSPGAVDRRSSAIPSPGPRHPDRPADDGKLKPIELPDGDQGGERAA